MNFKIAVLSILLLLFVACKEKAGDKKQSPTNTTPKPIYTENAFKITVSDSVLNRAAEIATYSENQKDPEISSKSIFKTEANKDRGIVYELNQYKTDASKEYVQLVIWENGLRVFEYDAEHTNDAAKLDTTQITKKRNLWIQLCNAHNAESLVTQLYTADALYFNHKPLITGTADLVKEYGYMNDPNYMLTLKPSIIKVVNSNIAFEIGQCKGSYNGKYILVWQKQPNGDWKIFLDSNV